VTKKLSATFDNGPKTDADSPEVRVELFDYLAIPLNVPNELR
jgi:hypothetical protein